MATGSVKFDLAKSGYTVRPAEGRDSKACRMLLPNITPEMFCMVAEDGAHGLIVGAVSISRRFRQKPPVGPGIEIHVIKPCRRSGVGTALLEGIGATAAVHGAQAIYAANRVEEGSDEMQAWRWLGFTPLETVEEHLLPLAEFEPRLAPLVDRMHQKGTIPTEARIIPLYEADKSAVLELHVKCMGGDRESISQKLHGHGVGAYHPRYSRVLMIGERVMGCILGHRTSKEVFWVDANFIDPELRGRWANVWLKLEATRGALSVGAKNFHFSTFDQY